MDIVITGGSGAIGSFASNELMDRGHDVTVFDLQEPEHVSNVDFEKGDVTDPAEVTGAVSDADAVIHMVSMLGDACEDDPVAALNVNVGGTVNVLEATKNTDTRVIYISSKAAFGPIAGEHAHPQYLPLQEDVEKKPEQLYGITKLAAEHYCKSYVRKYDSDISIFRFGTTYGPYKGTERHSISFVDQLVQRAIDGETIELSGGDQREDFIYHADIANGLADALETDRLHYPSYHLGSGSLGTVRNFADVLEDYFPEASFQIADGTDFYGGERSYYAFMDISRARADFGFDPEYAIRDGLRDSLQWRGVL